MELFNFEKDQVTRFIEDKLDTFNKCKEPLNYTINKLVALGHSLTIKSLDKIDLNKVKERKGKNYHWSVFIYKNVTLVIRRYNQHLTIFTKVIKEPDHKGRVKFEYGAFTFRTDLSKFSDDQRDKMTDLYWDKPFTGLNEIIHDLLKLLVDKTYGVSWVWNSACLKVPDYVEIKLAFSQENIISLDNFIFCMEELSNIYQELFAENTMLQKLKELKEGNKLNDRYKIGKVITKVKDEYYHGVGMDIVDTMNKEKTNFQDVYSLTRYHCKDIFKNIYLYNGEVYLEGGEFKEGEPVAYKDEEIDNVTLFKDTYPKENFITLIKY